MEGLFASLSGAVSASWPLALVAAGAWGVLSIVLSPCHLASIPLVIAWIGDQGPEGARHAPRLAAVFATGILVTIAAVGIVTASLGRMLGDVGGAVSWALALVFVALGLHFLDVLPLPGFGGGPALRSSRRGTLGAFLLGLVFGIGVGPCTFAYMAPMLGVTLRVAASHWGYGVLLLLAYGVGHCAVIVLAGASAPRVQRALRWNEGSRAAVAMRRLCGVLVILGGAWLVYTAP